MATYLIKKERYNMRDGHKNDDILVGYASSKAEAIEMARNGYRAKDCWAVSIYRRISGGWEYFGYVAHGWNNIWVFKDNKGVLWEITDNGKLRWARV